MTDESAKWEERYGRPGYWAGSEPAPFLREILPLAGAPRLALDLAMGEGRNAIFLAQQGWRVTGVELAAGGLNKAEQLARERGVNTWRAADRGSFEAPAPGVRLIQADLSVQALPRAEWKLVVVMCFLLRPLLAAIRRAVAPGGYLAFETYTVRHLEFAEWHSSRAYLLEPGELRAAFSDFDILVYREYAAGKGVASLFARKNYE